MNATAPGFTPKIRELYLSCLNCKRIPDWTDIQIETNFQGQRVKKYLFDGMCPHCGGGEFAVVEVRSE